MNIKNKKMKLGVSVRWVGYFASAWRDPDVPSDGGVNYGFYEDMAKTAERGLFDIFFFADNLGMPIDDVPPGTLGHAYGGADLEPYTLCAALSRVTRNMGLVVTASTYGFRTTSPNARCYHGDMERAGRRSESCRQCLRQRACPSARQCPLQHGIRAGRVAVAGLLLDCRHGSYTRALGA